MLVVNTKEFFLLNLHSQRREMPLFLTTNMAAVTSLANQQSMHRSIAARTEWPQGIQKIPRIFDVVLPFLVARGRILNSVCTNEMKMAKAVVNKFISKVEVNTFTENGVRFSVTVHVRVSQNRFTNSYLSDFNTIVRITRGQKTDFSQFILQTRHLQ